MLFKIKHNDELSIDEFIVFSNLHIKENYPDYAVGLLMRFNKTEIISREIKEKTFANFLIRIDDKTIGIVSFEDDKNALNIVQFYLDKKYRNYDSESKIFEELKEIALNNGLKNITVALFRNNEFCETLKKLGFKKSKDYIKYIGDDVYLYKDEYLSEA